MGFWWQFLEVYGRIYKATKLQTSSPSGLSAMYEYANINSKQANYFGETIYGAGSVVIESESGAYGEKLLRSVSVYV
ncbi:unnamed protein product [Dovyalis caffra]|uniref:Uncharacterized protein n=1 Tax=Dovyalis caffra TaxID=77055 RepID=A0AAV1RP62_9ROSI|nr:unnamed protein product [Dovyalis caffra]